MAWLKSSQALDEARDKELAKAALAIFALTEEGKALREKITALNDPEADDLWNKMVQG